MTTPDSLSLLEYVRYLGPAEFWSFMAYFFVFVAFLSRRLFFRSPLAVVDGLLGTGAVIFIFCFISSGAIATTLIYHSNGVDMDAAFYQRLGYLQTFLLTFVLSAFLMMLAAFVPPKRTAV